MLFTINIREDLENLNELASLYQVKAVRLQDKLGKKKFSQRHEKSIRTSYKNH